MINRLALLATVFTGMLAPGVVLAADRMPDPDTVIADEGTIGNRWMLADGASLPIPVYPLEFASRGDDVCVAVGYRIRKDGTTSDFAVLRQWSSAGGGGEPAPGYWEAFARAGAGAVSQWRFAPRADVAVVRETYTVATMGFAGSGNPSAQSRAQCRIQDLAGLVQARSSWYVMNLSRERRDIERLQRMRAEQHRRSIRPIPGNPVPTPPAPVPRS